MAGLGLLSSASAVEYVLGLTFPVLGRRFGAIDFVNRDIIWVNAARCQIQQSRHWYEWKPLAPYK